MCYDIKTKLETQLKRAKRKNNPEWVAELEKKLKPYLENHYHVSGFTHPNVLIYTSEKPNEPQLYQWGLVPSWVKDESQKLQLWNKTINARGETLFEKPSFKSAAQSRHCILYVDGFYEHHHYKGKTYPFFIYRKDSEPMPLACIYEHWVDKKTGEMLNTFSIVTTQANTLMGKIHNNPKLTAPRMPVILDEIKEEIWLDINSKSDFKKILIPYPTEMLNAHTVMPLRGKYALGNIPECSQVFNYEELPLAI